MTPYKVIEFGRATPERGGETGQDAQIFGRKFRTLKRSLRMEKEDRRSNEEPSLVG